MKNLGWIGLTLLAFWLTACQNTSFSKGQQATVNSTPPGRPPTTPPPYVPPPVVTPPPYIPPPIVTPPPYYPPPIVTPPPYVPPPTVTPPPFTPPVTPPPYVPPPTVTPPPYVPPPTVTPPPYVPPPTVTPPPYVPPPTVTPPPYVPPPTVTPPPYVPPPTVVTPPAYPPAPPAPQGGVIPPQPMGGSATPMMNHESVMLPQGGQATSVPWTSLPQNNLQTQVSQGAPAPVEVPPETTVPIAEPSTAPVPSEGPVTPPPTHTCEPATIERRKTDKLDILFIADTSDSLKSERTRIVSQMNNFIKSLDPKTDYQIGVVLAHAPADRTDYPCLFKDKDGRDDKRKCEFAREHIKQNKMGQLYSTGKNDPAVLKFSEIRSTKKLIQMLEKKMANPPEDYSPGQGELNLYNAYRVLTEDNLNQAMVAQGMFRKDAVLAVFFITDEQDVCYNYKELNPNVKPAFEAKQGKVPWTQADLSKDINGRDPTEQWTYENICNIGKNGKPIQYYDVAAAAKEFVRNQGMKSVIFSGAVFWNNDTIPRCFADKSRRQSCKSGKTDEYADEKEIGYGYIDLFRGSHMSPIDLASDDFGSQLTSLGLQTSAEMIGSSTVDCTITDGAADSVIKLADKHSFKVELQDANGHVTTIDSTGADASLYAVPETDADGHHLRIALPREKVKKLLENGNATARITFSEVRDGEQGGLIQAVKRIKFFRPHLKANAHKAEATPSAAPAPAPVEKQHGAVKADKAEKRAVEKKTEAKPAMKKVAAKTPAAHASTDPLQSLKDVFSASEKQNAKPAVAEKKKTSHKKVVKKDDDSN